MPKFAANLSMMFTELDFLDRFEAAAANGFEAVEFLFPYEYPAAEIAARLEANGLVQALFNMPPGDWASGMRGLAALPGREADFAATLDTALAYAEALGCRKLHCMAGILPAGVERARAFDTYVKNLALVAEHMAAAGILVVIEPINTRDMPGFFLNRSGEARQVIETVGAENLKLQFDLYHCQIMEGDLAIHIRDTADITGHIQIAGVPERHEPDIGEINYPYLFQAIDTSGYEGWIGCEYRPRGPTVAGLGWFAPYRRR
ncbi:MAG TPA: 2-oxo-tetronate isomerase [Stellaceae bacterium]|nr:2-oxo-tetronate isomerase [Stellaceae bacterium]